MTGMISGVRSLIGILLAFGMLISVGCAGSETKRSTGTYVDDKTISTKVEGKLAADSLTKALQVKVETYNGVVQLSGFVNNEETIRRAEEIARSVEGVKEVRNNLIVRR